ncbi:MAG TPA: ATP-binding protein [Chthoniobacterales bacterium]|jgi:two-component system sensor histidine kinase QseC|nr:ATP-binding protein [Chthoniobacterales bacterium]
MRSIQQQLILGLTTTICGLWIAGSFATWLALRKGLIAEFDQAHLTDLYRLSSLTEQSPAGLKFDSTGEILPAFQRPNRPDYFQLWETDGATLYRSPSLLDLPDLPRKSGSLIAPVTWNLTLPDGRRGRAAAARFVPNEDEDTPRPPGSPPLTKEAILVAAFHREELDGRLRLVGVVLLLSGLGMSATTIAIVKVAIRRGLRPLAKLAERTGTIDAQSLQVRFPVKNLPEELLPIAQHLNNLLARLEAAFARERRFSADAAHELRTPIAELRTLAEVSLKWPDDHAAAQNALEEALSIALQMEAIATGLLALARCESGVTNRKSEPLALAELLRETAEPWRTKAQGKQLELKIDIPPQTCWFTDRAGLRLIVGNLLSNAVEYSERGTTITVTASPNGTSDTLRISNRNRDLTPDDLPHLFERFWRKDRARSSSEHSGLGLAVARACSASLGLELQATLQCPDLVFTLSGASGCLPDGGSAGEDIDFLPEQVK